MWISRLDLLAFGRFTNVKLSLGPGFHLVYGPNEAGKSTTLRAIRQLLFGFDERTTDNFVHSNPNLRIGGSVGGEPGIELDVIRRKARKDSLRAADDVSTIDVEAWQTLLCGIDEDTFSHRYGIDYEQLVQGGHEIATGSGDLGEILFATGSGIMDLTAVQKQLNDEAAELFKAQGKKQRLNQAIVEWQHQREQVLTKLLSVGAWEETDRQRQDVQTQLDEIVSKLDSRTKAAGVFRRWQKARPLVIELDGLQRQLAPLSAIPVLPPEFGAKKHEAILLLEQANTQEPGVLAARQVVEKELEQLEVPEAFLVRADDLDKLATETGSYLKAHLDRPGLVERHALHTKALGEILAAQSGPSDHSHVARIHLDRTQRTRISQLGRHHAGLAQALEQAESRHKRLRERIDETRTHLATIPVTRPLNELREAVRAARSFGDLEAQWEKIRETVAVLEDEEHRQCRPMELWDGSMAKLKTMRIPAADVIRQWDSKFESSLSELSRLRLRLSELDDEHRTRSRLIETLLKEHQTPTEQDLEIARNQRGTYWAEIRERIRAGVLPSNSSIETFENSLQGTDRLADRLRSEADRVAQLAEQLAELKANETGQHEVSIRIAEREANRIELERQWHSEWPDLSAKPYSPREMQAWVARRDLLLQKESQISHRRVEADEILQRINEHCTSLSNQLMIDAGSTIPTTNAIGVATTNASTEMIGRFDSIASRQQLSFGWDQELMCEEPAGGDRESGPATNGAHSLRQLLATADERLERDAANQQVRKEAEQSLARLIQEESQALDQHRVAANEMEKWRTEWQEAMIDLNLAPDTTAETAEAHFETLLEMSDHQRQAEQLLERITGIDADAERFDASVKAVCRDVAPELVGLPATEAVQSLRERLAAARRNQIRFNELNARKKHFDQQLASAKESRERGKSLVADLCKSAGVSFPQSPSADNPSTFSPEELFRELAAIEERSRSRHDCEQKLEAVQSRLRELSLDEPIVEFMDQVRAQSLDDLALRIKELEQESIRLEAERDRLNHRLGGFDHQLKQMDGGADAAEAEEKQRQSLAQIRSDAEQYIRIKLASSVLHSAIERYREKIRGPILGVASELFRELTLESFDGLRVDEDDQNRPVLVGLRSSGREAIPVTGMSEGTCDQLYLSLRLASLQLESAPRSQLPFIVDDILIQFDDARAGAALKILSRFGRQRQVIFFTHHEHLLDIAKTALSGEYAAHRLEI